MTLLTHWPSALPELVLVTLIVVLPGLLVAAALGFRREELFGAAPALSLGVLSIADVVAVVLGIPWGLGVVAAVTVALAVAAGAVWFVLLRGRVTPRPAEPRWSWAWSAGIVGLGCLASGFAIARGIGSPESISQTFDSALHVNGIANVVAHHSAAPSVVGGAAFPSGPAPFYPPLFHGIAGLLVLVAGVSPIAAANLVAVAIGAVIWPLSMAFLVRTLVGPSRFALAFSMGAVSVVSVFPALMLSFGVLWPNALSYSMLPGVLALAVLLLRHTAFRWVGSLPAGLALVVVAPALYYTHPGAVFALMAVGLPLLVAAEGRLVAWSWSEPRRRAIAIAVCVLSVVALWVVWNGLYHVSTLNSVRRFYWNPRQSVAQAVGECIFLTSSLSGQVAVIGALALLGVVSVFAMRSNRWLVASHAVVVALVAISTGTDGPLRPTLTGFWYNDGFRLAAMLPLTGIPLATLGAGSARAWLAGQLQVLAARRPGGLSSGLAARTGKLAQPLSAVLVGIVVLVLLPGNNPLAGVTSTVRFSYSDFPVPLVTPDEAALYRRIAQWSPPGTDILASPWTGGVYAGVLSGRDVVYPHMVTTNDAPRKLLMTSFDEFTTNPSVCRAVKALHVAIVVDDSRKFDPIVSAARIAQYKGLSHLATTKGLTLLGHSKTASVYRVGSCSTG
ncbi:MAG TPA: DUF6541 family protein [Pedococcus sp.]|nr:DUF6541 family protein [Pedococcus sp.]